MSLNKARHAVLITGCSSGIGYHAAKTLQQHSNYHVIASARRAEDVARLKNEGLDTVWLDLNDSESIQQAVSEALEMTGGKLYALFNNAAYGQPGAVEDLSREVLREQFETNLFGTHELTQRIIPVMRQQGYGRIIQNSSLLGFVSLPYRGAYNASKHALEGLSDTLRLELAAANIQVSLIAPGPINSRFRANAWQMYQQHINRDASPHREAYLAMEQRLTKQGPAAPFTLDPDAVTKKLVHALESKRPKARYYVTFPSYLFMVLRRVLSTRWLDWVLNKIPK
ncbi:MAG: SDR family oxidoreductase [Gammaproteobacteria bacterium]|nr:SDR family oxidoreductase [Gammaproteobacteria bacterium]